MFNKTSIKFKNFSTSLKVVIIFCVIIILWMLSGLIPSNKSSSKNHTKNTHLSYKVVNSKATEKAKILSFTGIIEAKDQIDLINEVDGKVISISVNEGTKLDKDQEILALEKKDYIDKLNSAKRKSYK